MPRLTLKNVKDSRIPYAVNLCGSQNESKLIALLNEAQQRLLNKGKWLGTYARYRFCSTNGCITMPRQIETVEAFVICNSPGIIRNEWYEYQETGPGQLSSDSSWGRTMVDRGEAVAFDDVTGTGKYIRVYADHASDVGKKIILRYWTENGNKMYSQYGGAWQEGEQITLVAPPAYAVTSSTVLPGGLYSVIKDPTNRCVRLYEYNGSAITKALAMYEPSETMPVYRRYQIPGLESMANCGNTCTSKQVTVLAKLRFIPAALDNDELMIGNLPALKFAMQAIQYEEQERWDLARAAMHGGTIIVNGASVAVDGAVPLLEQELAAWMGDGPVATPRMQNPAVWGFGAIENVVD